MQKFNFHSTGRHFVQLPVPDRVLRAFDNPPLDHHSPAFAAFTTRLLDGLKQVFRTQGEIAVYSCSSSGAREAALSNTLCAGDRIVMAETGYFSGLWRQAAQQLGLRVDYLQGDWRHGADAGRLESVLQQDTGHEIRAVCVVHSELSSGVTSNLAELRAALDRESHPALLLVDASASLGALAYHHDEWGVDVTIAGSAKGLMLPPGLGFNAISRRALEGARRATLAKGYWNWQPILDANRAGCWPSAPPTNLLFGLAGSLGMLFDEGLECVAQRHYRHAEATRRAVAAWGFELVCADPEEFSDIATVVYMPLRGDGSRFDPGAFRKLVEERFELSLAEGLGQLADSTFRIGHIGDLNDLTVAGALAGIEMGLKAAGLPYQPGGAQTALDYLANMSTPAPGHGANGEPAE